MFEKKKIHQLLLIVLVTTLSPLYGWFVTGAALAEEEGMELIRSYRDIPSRSDVEPDTPLLKGVKIYPSDPKSAEESAKYLEIFRKIFIRK